MCVCVRACVLLLGIRDSVLFVCVCSLLFFLVLACVSLPLQVFSSSGNIPRGIHVVLFGWVPLNSVRFGSVWCGVVWFGLFLFDVMWRGLFTLPSENCRHQPRFSRRIQNIPPIPPLKPR